MEQIISSYQAYLFSKIKIIGIFFVKYKLMSYKFIFTK